MARVVFFSQVSIGRAQTYTGPSLKLYYLIRKCFSHPLIGLARRVFCFRHWEAAAVNERRVSN